MGQEGICKLWVPVWDYVGLVYQCGDKGKRARSMFRTTLGWESIFKLWAPVWGEEKTDYRGFVYQFREKGM